MDRKLVLRVVLSYSVDVLVIFLLFVPSLVSPWIRPFQRPIDLNDPSIQYPISKLDFFPSWTLPFLCYGVPLLSILGAMALERFKRPRLLLAAIGCLYAVAAADFVTQVLKNLTGRLRPDFLARCIPKLSSSGDVMCTQTNLLVVEEGRRSFPSGHASTSCAGLTFLALFLAGQLMVFDGQGRAVCMTACLLPVTLALVISASRVLDNKHHVLDVGVGMLLGVAAAIPTYMMYFPLPFMASCNEPYTIRLDKLAVVAEGAPAAGDPEGGPSSVC